MTKEEYFKRIQALMESLNDTIQVWRSLNQVSLSETLVAMEGAFTALTIQDHVEAECGEGEDDDDEGDAWKHAQDN